MIDKLSYDEVQNVSNELKRLAKIIDKLIDVGYLYRPAEDHISLSEDNFYSLP